MKFPVKTDLVSVPRNRSGSSAWNVEHKQRVWEGVGQVAKEGPGKLLPHWSGCSLGPAEDGGQSPVLTYCSKDEICRAATLGWGSSPPHIRLQKQSTNCLACISSFYRHTGFFFFLRAWKRTSTAQENHFPPSSPHEMKAVTGRILLFVDLGTRWNDSHRSEVNMFLRLLLFISLGFMGFPVHGRGNSSFTCVCAEQL